MSKFILKTTTGLILGEYTSFEEAVKQADENAQLGYGVHDENGAFVYGKHNQTVLNILAFAKKTADYMRENQWKYGNAKQNPFLTKEEKIVSCDRFVGWTLGDAGYVDGQPEKNGLPLYGHNLDGGDGSLENFLILHNFTRIDNLAEVKAGDVLFVGYSHKELPLSIEMREYPSHTFIAAGDYVSAEDSVYRYDAGSDVRIQSVQPSCEKIGLPEKVFRFAYRAPVKS